MVRVRSSSRMVQQGVWLESQPSCGCADDGSPPWGPSLRTHRGGVGLAGENEAVARVRPPRRGPLVGDGAVVELAAEDAARPEPGVVVNLPEELSVDYTAAQLGGA